MACELIPFPRHKTWPPEKTKHRIKVIVKNLCHSGTNPEIVVAVLRNEFPDVSMDQLARTVENI